MSEGQKILMLTENYNIYKILDNSILGFFLGIISGIGIEAFMNGSGNLCTNIIFIILCVVSIVLMLMAMSTNSKFVQKCHDNVLNQEEYKTREQIIGQLSVDTQKQQLKFKRLFWGAIIVLFVGVVILKMPLSQKHTIQSVNLQVQVDSLKVINNEKALQILELKQLNDSILKSNIDSLKNKIAK